MLTVLLCAAAAASTAQAKTYRVTIAPAKVDRAVQVVEFRVPADAAGATSLQLRDGTLLPLQVTDGMGRFVIPSQEAGETLVYLLKTDARARGRSGVEAKEDNGRLRVTVAGKPAFEYRMDKEDLPRTDIKQEYKRAGYVHPVFTPSGTIVTDDYPPQHVHQHGIWSPWTKTSFQGRSPDFWNMGQKTGTVEFVALDRTWGGRVHGGFVARHRFVDLSAPSPVVALHETWEVTAYNTAEPPARPGVPPATVFDLKLTQTCATNDPLILPKYHYGGLGLRGRGEWFGADKAYFLTSDGETDRVKANHQKMRWVHLWGQLDGGPAGIAVLGHPDNFRAPQPVRVHPREPYVSFTPSWEGDWKIEPGRAYIARYRFVAIDGPPDRARLDALWNGYAIPAEVSVKAEEGP